MAAETAARSRSRGEVRQDIEAIREDFEQLRADMAELMQDVVNEGRGRASETRERVTDAFTKGVHTVNNSVREAADCGKRAVSSAQHQVEERPLASVAIAFGVGMAIGSLMMRRK